MKWQRSSRRCEGLAGRAVSVLVLDANILIRAVLGQRVRSLVIRYDGTVQFLVPESAVAEAREHLPRILIQRRIRVEAGLEVLNSLSAILDAISTDSISGFEVAARQRLAQRDPDDWPVLATALAFRSGVWTEDSDFFGTGVATWTTANVELFLKNVEYPEK